MKNIYERAVAAGLKVDNHCSDLYLPVNVASQELVENYEYKGGVTMFRSQIDGEAWYDIPFAYEPWWNRAEKTVEAWAKGVSQ